MPDLNKKTGHTVIARDNLMKISCLTMFVMSFTTLLSFLKSEFDKFPISVIEVSLNEAWQF